MTSTNGYDPEFAHLSVERIDSNEPSLIYLTIDDNGKYEATYEPKNKVLEMMVINKSYIPDPSSLPKLLTQRLNMHKTDKFAIREFILIVQHHLPYSEYPFANFRYGIEPYLRGDFRCAELPLLSDMPYFNVCKRWKHLEYHYLSRDTADKRYFYETFVDKWIYFRIAAAGDTYLPYEVLHSLDDSGVCTMTHAFVEGFRCCRCDCDVGGRLQFIAEQARLWIGDHLDELDTKDVNGETPLEFFNYYYPEFETDGTPILNQDERYTAFRRILTRSTYTGERS